MKHFLLVFLAFSVPAMAGHDMFNAPAMGMEWEQMLDVGGSSILVTGRYNFDQTTGREEYHFYDKTGKLISTRQISLKSSESPASLPSAIVSPMRTPYGKLKPRHYDIRNRNDIVFSKLPKLGAKTIKQATDTESDKGTIIGIKRSLPEPLDVRPGLKRYRKWVFVPNEGWVWTFRLTVDGAKAIRILIRNIHASDYVSWYAFDSNNPDRMVGPYTKKDVVDEKLWTESLFASSVTFQCFVPLDEDINNISFTIGEIIDRFDDIVCRELKKAAECHNDVSCFPSWIQTSKSVAGLAIIKNSEEYWCSGTLLNDNDPSYGTDYFITANHCVCNQAEAQSIELYWLYQTTTCSGTPPSLYSTPRTWGAKWLAGMNQYTGNDFSFLRLNQRPPAGVVYAAWSSDGQVSPVAVGIHHPGWSHKRISFGNLIDSSVNYLTVLWSSGTTEPGCSGGPVFNEAQEFIGQLYGGSSGCLNPLSYYGRFNVTFGIIQDWLLNGDSSLMLYFPAMVGGRARMGVLGTNGAAIASGAAASADNGTDFGEVAAGTVVTNTFTIFNAGNKPLFISGCSTNGDGTASFVVGGFPATVAKNATNTFSIAFNPAGNAGYTGFVSIVNSSATTPYVINVQGAGAAQ